LQKSLLFHSIIFIFLIAFFQNCSKQNASFSSSSKPAPPLASQNGGGQPYEGKPYVLPAADACPDGTLVKARIILKSATTAQLVRDNCQTIASKDLGVGDFFIDSSDQLNYLANIFIPETPAIDLKPLTSWYYQLEGSTQSQAAQVYDIDMFNTSAANVQSLKTQGHVVICYISVGSYENYRPDASSFNSSDIGNVLGGGSSDRWLDTRSASVRSIMLARMDLAKSRGCDGVDLDNVDAFSSSSGFPLDANTQTDYNSFLARAAHDRGLVVALNNVGDLAAALVNDFDFVVSEQCYENNECAKYQPFIKMGKPVFDAEYTAYSAAQCSAARADNISLGFYSAKLDGSVFNPCP